MGFITREESKTLHSQMTTQAQQTTSESEVEKRMFEWHDMLFKHQLEIVNRMNPTTAFVVGMMANGSNFLELAGLITYRLMGDMGPYEFIVKVTRTCLASDSEHEALEGAVAFFQGLIDTGLCCDSKIKSIKEELDVVLNNIQF